MAHKFTQLSVGNPLGHNLTELNVAYEAQKGFLDHNDWVGHLKRYQFISEFLDKRNDKRLLDVGCGRFNLLKYMWRTRNNFSGDYIGIDLNATKRWIDPNTSMAFERMLWDRGDVHLIKGDVITDEFPDVNSDVVVCLEMLEHVPRDKAPALIQRLYDWTNPGGYLFLSSPNAGVSKSVSSNHVGPEGSREWAYEEKIMMAQDAGFVLVDAWGIFIQLKNIPEHAQKNVLFDELRRSMPHSWFTVLMAGPFPKQSNNSMMLFQRVNR